MCTHRLDGLMKTKDATSRRLLRTIGIQKHDLTRGAEAEVRKPTTLSHSYTHTHLTLWGILGASSAHSICWKNRARVYTYVYVGR